MFDAAARELLNQPIIVRISTIDSNGYPHTVPVWFILDGNDLVVFTARRTAKVKHIQKNPKGSIAVGGDPLRNNAYVFAHNGFLGYPVGKKIDLPQDWNRKLSAARII